MKSEARTPPTTGDTAHVSAAEQRVWALLETISDPEIPVLSIVDLGIVRSVACRERHAVAVGLSPTYSGCPATAVIRRTVVDALRDAGFAQVEVHDVIAPPWSSDWISERGRSRLAEYGIAPPVQSVDSVRRLLGAPPVQCPRCGSSATECVSEFGSTPCKALYRCTDCREPFDYFKCI
jgi:ring-1,2-phenylacetyl-CoA epoxidase subunit PaaD